MKTPKRAMNSENWLLQGDTINVHVPMAWKRRGGRKVIIAPDGSDAWAPAKPRPDEKLIRALARANRWKRLLDEASYRSAGELAEAEGLTRSFINRLLRLTLLAPDIQEAILDGRQPKALQLNDLVLLPDDWGEQRKRLVPPAQHLESAPGFPIEGDVNRCQKKSCNRTLPRNSGEL
jgi:hypothetical protein